MTDASEALSGHYDVAVVGSGAGGGTLAYRLATLGRRVLLIEQGGFLPKEADNANEKGVFGTKYVSPEPMEICGHKWNFPVHAYVGGQTKFYGAALYRLREADFGPLRFPDGESPAWPITYQDLEPYYSAAEQVYRVHGSDEDDPTAPPRSAPYPYPAVAHEPLVERLVRGLRRQGLHVSSIPKAIDLREGGGCRFCATCDAYACPTDGKLDTEVACVNPGLATGNLHLATHARCDRVLTNDSGDRVTSLEVQYGARTWNVRADVYVLACDVVHSPALLLRSASKAHPQGLANSSGQVGRNMCGHNASWFFLPTLRRLPPLHQKTFAVNDYYLGTPDYAYPLGVLQAAGRMPVWMRTSAWMAPFARHVNDRSLTCFTMSEIWPDADNRVTIGPDGRIRVAFKPNNLEGFRRLRALFLSRFRRAGYPAAISPRYQGVGLPWHPVGTLRFGRDPKTSVLDEWCRTHDVENLYVVDSSFLSSAGAVNTSLTVMAQALRVADRIHGH
jgi:choline dehydrogenase-like flavoprotein